MKIICLKDNLIDAVNVVQKAVSTKSNVSALEGILIESTDDSNIKLTGNNLEIAIDYTIKADVSRAGSVVINSKILGDIVRKLPDAPVMIEVDDKNTVFIECDHAKFKISGLSSEGFPPMPVIEKEKSFIISQNVLKEMIRKTMFAMSTDDTRPILTGMYIEINSRKTVMVACDSFRVALVRYELPHDTDNISIVVPGKAVNEIQKILRTEDETAAVYIANNQIMVDMGSHRIVGRLLEGQYFKYRSFIPDEFSTNVVVDRLELMHSVERAALIISSDERSYPLTLKIKDSIIQMSAKSNLGNVDDVIRAEIEGQDIEIGFNPRYLAEALRVIDDENVEICFTNDIGPGLIKPVEGDEYTYLLLPVRKY